MGQCPPWHGADPLLLEVTEAGDPAPACQCHVGLHPLQSLVYSSPPPPGHISLLSWTGGPRHPPMMLGL
jgi:hypothetical protein